MRPSAFQAVSPWRTTMNSVVLMAGVSWKSCGCSAQQPLEVLALRKSECDWVVRRRIQPAQDLRVDAGVERSPGNDLLEQIARDAAGARERQQHAAGTQQLERVQVDVFVSARGSLGQCGSRRKLRRIEDDQVEAAPLVAQPAQHLKHVGRNELC